MNNIAEKLKTGQPELSYGRIVATGPDGFSVSTNLGLFQAGVAVSCVIRPEVEDEVLLCLDSSGGCRILSILSRTGENALRDMTFDGPVRISAAGGGLALYAREEVTLASETGLSLAAPEMEIDSFKATARVEQMTFLGKSFSSQVERLKTVADAVDSICRRMVQRLNSSYRYVEEHEEVQSASTRLLVEGTLTMQTGNTLHTADEHVKIDAEQIHLG